MGSTCHRERRQRRRALVRLQLDDRHEARLAARRRVRDVVLLVRRVVQDRLRRHAAADSAAGGLHSGVSLRVYLHLVVVLWGVRHLHMDAHMCRDQRAGRLPRAVRQHSPFSMGAHRILHLHHNFRLDSGVPSLEDTWKGFHTEWREAWSWLVDESDRRLRDPRHREVRTPVLRDALDDWLPNMGLLINTYVPKGHSWQPCGQYWGNRARGPAGLDM